MNVNGKEICHWAECMPFNGRTVKRSHIPELGTVLDFPDRNYDFGIEDSSAV